MTNAEKILRFIESNEDGVHIHEIQKFIVENILTHRMPYDVTRDRGVYASNLYGQGYKGLLPEFCDKKRVKNGVKYSIKKDAIIASPFYVSPHDSRKEIISKREANMMKKKINLI